jgi:hypothetical protein
MADASPKDYFTKKFTEAIAALKARGKSIALALLEAEPAPLALSTWDDVTGFAALHEYGNDDVALLRKAVWALTKTPRYQAAAASDLSVRVSVLTGETCGTVSDLDRHSSAMAIFPRTIREAARNSVVPTIAASKPKPPPPQAPKPPAPPPEPPPPAAKTSPMLGSSPFRVAGPGPLSREEQERRAAVIKAGLLPVKAPTQ